MDNKTIEELEKQNRKLKKTLIIVLIILFLSLSFIAYIFIYNVSSLDKEPVDTSIPTEENTDTGTQDDSNMEEQETDKNSELENNYNITIWDYSTEKNIGINIEGFEEIDQAGDPIWPSHSIFVNDPIHLSGSSYEAIEYYRNLEILLQVYADDVNFEISDLNDLEEVSGIGNAYYLKQQDSTDGSAPAGTVLLLEPTVTVQGFQAFKIIEYYNIIDAANGDTSYVPNDYSIKGHVSCVISLDQFDPTSEGYIEYSGVHPAGSEIDYCEMLDSLNEFTITMY